MNSGNHGNRESPLRCSARTHAENYIVYCVYSNCVNSVTDRPTKRKKLDENHEKFWQIYEPIMCYAKWKCFIGRLLNDVDILLFNRCWGAVILSFHWCLWNCCYESSLASLYGLPTHWHLQNVNSHVIEKSTNYVSCLRMRSEVMRVFR